LLPANDAIEVCGARIERNENSSKIRAKKFTRFIWDVLIYNITKTIKT